MSKVVPDQISIRVKAGSKKGPLIEESPEGGLIVYVREPAVNGKANAAVLQLLAKHYGVSKTQIEIVRGHNSKIKLIMINP